jgi:type I restriction enzyme, S subunit
MMRKKVNIKDLGTIITGTTPPTKQREYYGDIYNFIKPSNIDLDSRFFESSPEKLSMDAYEKYKNSFIPPYSTCVVTIGSIGEKICMTREISLTNQQINSVIPDKDKYDNMFIFYLLKHNLYKVKAANGGSSSGRENVNKSSFGNIEVEVPDLPTQRKIGKLLSSYDDLIENNLKRIKLLEESSELIYKEWFVNLRFPGYEKCNIVDELPEGWENKSAKEFGEVITGKTPATKRTEYYGGEIPFIKTPDMSDVYIIKTSQTLTEEGAKSQESKYIPRNSILISCIGSTSIGVTAITSELSQFNQQINALIPSNENYLYYLYFKFKSLREYLEALGSSGATMINVNKGKFENIEIVAPSNDILNKFANICKPIFNKILNLQYQNEKLKESRDILIPRLISGEIEI